MKKLSPLVLLISLQGLGQAPVSSLWTDYVNSTQLGVKSVLSDYSFSGYHFSEKEIPDVTDWEFLMSQIMERFPMTAITMMTGFKLP